MNVFNLGIAETTGLSIIVIYIGKLLVSKIGFLNKFCIPYPVVGGLLFALLRWALYQLEIVDFVFDPTLRTYFMICFFTTIGFSASLKVLKSGGKAVAVFLVCAIILTILQNFLSVGIATLLGENPLLGMATGSVPMTGGHGTSGAFGPILEDLGLESGLTIAIAAATFGLVSGSLIGGPIGSYLIKSKKLEPNKELNEELIVEENLAPTLRADNISLAFFQIALAVGIGYYVSLLLAKLHIPAFDVTLPLIGRIVFAGAGFVVPIYIGSMLVAALMRNIFKDGSKMEIKFAEVQALGDMFLAVFLAQAIMDLRLWELLSLALPLLLILFAQVILMSLYAIFVTFKAMGSDYDAAILAAGHCGFGLGATPNGVANMNAVTLKYGPSIKAFFVLPIVGGLFIDFFNSVVITTFISFIS